MYKDLIKNNTFNSLSVPKTIVPSPTEEDYEIGNIQRYFAQRANDLYGFVYEVNLDVFQQLQENPNWITEIVRWRISGPIDSVYNDMGTLTDKGVFNSNKASLMIASQKLKNIGLYLTNALQFHK